MKIFVAIPVYDGKLQVQTVKCLLEERSLAAMTGDEICVVFLPSCSVPAMGRNQLVQDFLDTDYDKLFFLDADITFELGDLLKVARSNADLVGGAYRYKLDQECYPVGWIAGIDLYANENKHLEVETLANGFLAISRNVFNKIKEANPGREYTHQGRTAYCYFQMIFKDGHLHSEDTYFCKEWRETGGKVFLDPEITLTHWDFNKPYVGHIGKWLKNRNNIQEIAS